MQCTYLRGTKSKGQGFSPDLTVSLHAALYAFTCLNTGANPAIPGSPVGGGADPAGGGRQHTILPNFPNKLHEIEKQIGS